jgi:hypothetical protein
MRAGLGLAGLFIVLLIGYLIYSSQIQNIGGGKPLKQQINTIAIQNDLLSLGQAEKLYLATNSKYATLEELQSSNIMNSIPNGSGSGYSYTVEVDGVSHFRITASSADPARTDLPTFHIDETLQISH